MTIQDMAGQFAYRQLSGENALNVDRYMADETMITLLSFQLNLTTEYLTLYFSEAVNTMIELASLEQRTTHSLRPV